MVFLIPIEYNRKKYPKEIHSIIEEIAGHFDQKQIYPAKAYSLHTEYYYYYFPANKAFLEVKVIHMHAITPRCEGVSRAADGDAGQLPAGDHKIQAGAWERSLQKLKIFYEIATQKKTKKYLKV